MTRAPTTVALRWPGTGTLKEARAAIRRGIPVDIELPLEVHYALFKHLHPDRPHTPSEEIDASGGAELLAPIATVAGLAGPERARGRGAQGALQRSPDESRAALEAHAAGGVTANRKEAR